MCRPGNHLGRVVRRTTQLDHKKKITTFFFLPRKRRSEIFTKIEIVKQLKIYFFFLLARLPKFYLYKIEEKKSQHVKKRSKCPFRSLESKKDLKKNFFCRSGTSSIWTRVWHSAMSGTFSQVQLLRRVQFAEFGREDTDCLVPFVSIPGKSRARTAKS